MRFGSSGSLQKSNAQHIQCSLQNITQQIVIFRSLILRKLLTFRQKEKNVQEMHRWNRCEVLVDLSRQDGVNLDTCVPSKTCLYSGSNIIEIVHECSLLLLYNT